MGAASLIGLVALAALAGPALAGQRGAMAIDAPDLHGTMPLYQKSFALVIGIDRYTGGWPRLTHAVSDAEAVAKELERQGFEVILKTDLGSDKLQRTIADFVYERGHNAEARLLIWYAGHGHTIGEEAYLVPADAPLPGTADWQFRRTALSMRDFGKFMHEARSKHVLAIFNSCFSGSVFETSRALENPAITRATSLPVREMISSGEADQTVSDDGTFRKLFVDALRGLEPTADANRDGYITGSELGLFLADKVTSLTQNRQSPRFGKMRAYGLDRGDFVFQIDPDTRDPEPAASGDTTVAALLGPEPAAQRATAPSLARPEEPELQPLAMVGGQTVLLMEDRLALSMIGTPFGARSDLVGVAVNGQAQGIGLGGSVAAQAGDRACLLTLMQIFAGENKAQFLVRCDAATSLNQAGRPSMTVKLDEPPSVSEDFAMSGGQSQVLQPGSVIISVLGTPFGARSDLVGVVVNGKRQGMGVGQQEQVKLGDKSCTLTVSTIHKGRNSADFLWRCP